MVRYEVRLVNEAGRSIGFGDRWLTHRVRSGPDGPVLGRKHVGITIACVDDQGRLLIAYRRHKIFDKVWTLAGDTHPYKAAGRLDVEGIVEAARRCARDDLGVWIRHWPRRLVLSYSAQDPRDHRFCENELLHVMVSRYCGPMHMNPRNAYELRWAEVKEVSREVTEEQGKEPIDRKYAPWVHAIFSLPADRVRNAFSAGALA